MPIEAIQSASLPQVFQLNIGFIESVIGILIITIGCGIAWGKLHTSVHHVQRSIDEIKPDLKDLNNKMAVLWENKLAPSNSPRQLNEFGNKILNGSGIKAIIDSQKTELLKLAKANKTTNPYDAEAIILATVKGIPERHPEILDKIKTGAFKTGVDLESVLFVGGIYLRNLIFPELGFQIEDLDKPLI